MDSSILPLAKAIIPKVPLIGKIALFHSLGILEHSDQWDLRTALTVNILRSFLSDSPPQSVSKIQYLTLKDAGVKGQVWISRNTIPAPSEQDVKIALLETIESLKEPGDMTGGYKDPELLPVEVEWTGFRAGATKSSPELQCSEEEKYKELMKEVTSEATVLYFHGGAYWLMDPATYRNLTKKLAKLTGGRCYNVRYRLAPQNPFPAALLDALVSYLSLLYPPTGSFHSPVDPSNIVLGGDSAGGNLCLVLLQTILELRRQNIQIQWNGKTRDVPVPGGITLCSPWADLTGSSPSCEANISYDYLPPMSDKDQAYTPCAVWPANPPRRHMYTEDSLLCHPLVSPLATRSWSGSCPMYLQNGTELLTDEGKHVAQLAALEGVMVVFEQYEAMPHCFSAMIESLPASTLMFERWSSFISQVVEGKFKVETKATLIKPKTLKEEPIEIRDLSKFSGDEVRQRMRDSAAKLRAKYADSPSKL